MVLYLIYGTHFYSIWNIFLSHPFEIQDGAFRVDLPSALYLDTPYTVQPGGCGDPGEYTHVTPAFLKNLDGSTTDVFGPPGKSM